VLIVTGGFLVTNLDQNLFDAAKRTRNHSQALYSRFKVGAALLCSDGSIFAGCNIESSSYGLTICAERVALFKALSEGHLQFLRMVVVTDTELLTPPCGACRQLMWDFCGDIEVVLASLRGDMKSMRLSYLFPNPFGRQSLNNVL
jgi:cytidine deaminase